MYYQVLLDYLRQQTLLLRVIRSCSILDSLMLAPDNPGPSCKRYGRGPFPLGPWSSFGYALFERQTPEARGVPKTMEYAYTDSISCFGPTWVATLEGYDGEG